MGASAESVRRHYETGSLLDRLLVSLTEAGHDVDDLSEADLGALGEFHSAGRTMTDRLADLAGIEAGDRVLDVGAGIAGPARHLAATRGARVVALDLVEEFCEAARDLNARTGLDDLVEVRQGNATDLRFDDASFDVVWTQHVAMNIEDKHALYTEFRRVAAPGARLALYDVVAGSGDPIHLPVPWASAPGQSFLETPAVVHKLVEAAGWRVSQWNDVTDDVVAVMAGGPPPGPNLTLLMRDAEKKLATYRRNLEEERVRVVMAVAVAR